MPQIADGGGWQTTVVITNTNASPASASLLFYMDSGGGATQSWSPSFIEGGSTQGMTIPAGATQMLHTPGAASSATTGWGQLAADSGVTGYAIVSQIVSGQQNQDEVVPATAPVGPHARSVRQHRWRLHGCEFRKCKQLAPNNFRRLPHSRWDRDTKFAFQCAGERTSFVSARAAVSMLSGQSGLAEF